jgi:hypothetical protein
MRKNGAVIIFLITITSLITVVLFLALPCISIARGERRVVREMEKMIPGKQSDIQKSSSTAQLPMKGIGCWVTKRSVNNPYIYSDVFGWYVVDFDSIDSFNDKLNRPLFMAFGKKYEIGFSIEKMKEYKSKIAGVVWDYEIRDTPQYVAERDLKKVYSEAKSLNLLFGVFAWANPKNSLKANGVSYENAGSFADFLMPMLYVQLYDMKRQKLEELIAMERVATRLPLIATLTLETTRKNLQKKITPQEIVSIYKNLPVDGFCVWNVKDLNEEYVTALSSIKR